MRPTKFRVEVSSGYYDIDRAFLLGMQALSIRTGLDMSELPDFQMEEEEGKIVFESKGEHDENLPREDTNQK